MADALIDTHVLLWMLDGSLPRRSATAARKLADAITAHGGLAVHHAMRDVSREQVPDPFDRIIAATALLADLPLLTADSRIRTALGERAVW